MPQFMLEVNGTEREVALPSLSVQHVVNGPDILEADIQDDDGSINLETDQVVKLTQIDVSPSEVYFEGLLQTKGNETWTGCGYSRLRKITAFDYSVYTTFVDAALTTDGSLSLEALLQTLVDDYLTDYGVTLHPSQATGPTIPPNVFEGVKAQAILNSLSEQTGWVWKIDVDKQLRMWDPATESAPFNVTATNETYVHDIQTSTQAQKKYNRVFVEGGNGYHTILNEQHFGDGSKREFPMNAPIHYFDVDYTSSLGFMVGLQLIVVRTGGTTTEYANDQSTAQWRVDNYDGSTGPFRNNPTLVQLSGATLGPTEYILFTYAAQYPFRMVADGRGSPPDPARDLTLVRPLVFGRDALQAIADETLAAMSGDSERATYPTTRTDIRPGQTQTINVPEAGVNGTYTCTDARLRYETGGDTGEFWIDVTLVNEVTARSFWLNLLDRWLTDNQGSSSAGIGAVGTTAPIGPAPPHEAVQSNQNGQFGADASFKHNIANKLVTIAGAAGTILLRGTKTGSNYGVNSQKSVFVAAIDNEDSGPLVAAFGSLAAGLAKFLTIAQFDDGTTYVEQEEALTIATTDGNIQIAANGSGKSIQLDPTTRSYLGLASISSGAFYACAYVTSQPTYTIDTTGVLPVYFFDPSGGNVTVSLPALSNAFVTDGTTNFGSDGRRLYIKNVSTSRYVILDPNSTETIDGGLAKVLAPGQSCVLQATRISGVSGWHTVSETVPKRVVTLTNAQVKSLPTAGGINIVPAPPSGFYVAWKQIDLIGKFSSGAYTNINATYSLMSASTSSGGLYGEGPIDDSTTSPAATQLTRFLAAASRYARMNPLMTALGAGNAYVLRGLADGTVGVDALTALDGLGVDLYADNNGSGDYTGGHASNTLTAVVDFTIEAVP